MRASDRYKLQMWNKVKRELNKKGKVLRRNKREREGCFARFGIRVQQIAWRNGKNTQRSEQVCR